MIKSAHLSVILNFVSVRSEANVTSFCLKADLFCEIHKLKTK